MILAMPGGRYREVSEEQADAALLRIGRGAGLLDSAVPGWALQVNVCTIRLESPMRCILGQLYGDYSRGCLSLGVEGDEYGFCEAGFEYIWMEKINERRRGR